MSLLHDFVGPLSRRSIIFFLSGWALVIVLTTLSFSFGLKVYLTPLPSPSSPLPPPTPQPCNYTSWSQFSFQCFEFPNGSLAQIRTQVASPPLSYCEQRYESRDCDPRQCLVDTRIQTTIFCTYDDTSHFCNASFYHISVSWYFFFLLYRFKIQSSFY